MSKSLGNVVDPVALLRAYGSDAVRCYFLAEGPQQKDTSFVEEELVSTYNGKILDSYSKRKEPHITLPSEPVPLCVQQEVCKGGQNRGKGELVPRKGARG